MCSFWTTARAEPPTLLGSSEPVIIERDAHTRVWQKVVEYQTSYGRTYYRTNEFIELATGLCKKDSPDAPWTDSQEVVEIVPGGVTAVATQGQHRLTFSADITAAAPIVIDWRGEKRLRLRPTGLAYVDRLSGRSVMFAGIKRAAATSIEGNRLTWQKCWDGADASLTCVYTRAGLTVLLTFHSMPPTPMEAGLAGAEPENVLLQLWHEAVEPPEPAITRTTVASEEGALRAVMAQPDVIDEYLDFSSFFIGPGMAFAVDSDAEPSVRIAKTWGRAGDGKTWLVENANYSEIKPLLETLPLADAATKDESIKYLAGGRIPPRIQQDKEESLTGGSRDSRGGKTEALTGEAEILTGGRGESGGEFRPIESAANRVE